MFLAYYCDTQKQSPGEFAKFAGKQLCRSLFFSKVAVRLKKRLQHCFLRTLPEDCSGKFFFELVLYRYSRNNWSFFQVIGLFLLLMSCFWTRKPRHVDEPSKQNEQRLYWQGIHASVNMAIGYFSLNFLLLNQDLLTFLV